MMSLLPPSSSAEAPQRRKQIIILSGGKREGYCGGQLLTALSDVNILGENLGNYSHLM